MALNLLAGTIGDLSTPVRTALACGVWLPVFFAEAGPMFLRAGNGRRCAALALLFPVAVGLHAGGLHGIFALLLTLVIFFVLEGGNALNQPALETLAAKPTLNQPAPHPALSPSDGAKVADSSAVVSTKAEGRVNASGVLLGILFLTTAGSGLWVLARQALPAAFMAEEHVSMGAAKFTSWLRGEAVVFGPTYSGVSLILFFVLFSLSAFLLSGPRNLRLLVEVLAGQVLLLLGYQLAFHWLLAKCELVSPWVLLGTAQMGLFALGWGLAVLHLRSLSPQPVPWRIPVGVSVPLAAGAVVLMFCTGDAFLFLQKSRPPRVLLYDDGTLDWSVPVYGQYSGVSGGMFGSLANFLQRRGCEAFRSDLTNDWQNHADVVVVFNLMHKFKPEEKRQIWEFVRKGGGLLAVGDHTGTTAIREPFNDLLEPVNAEFNFDCAMPIQRGWAGGMQWFPHYTTAALESEADNQIVVGASLTLRAPARPLLVGRHGWSDKGDLQNKAGGYLGDRHFSPDERLGDVILVATANYGAGRVMVFGDTSTFQNGALARAGDYVEAIFRWFVAPRSWLPPALSALGLGMILISAGWLLVARRTAAPAIVVVLFVGLYLGDVASGIAGRVAAKRAIQPQTGDALIDASHLSRCDADLWEQDGLGGLIENLMRKGYMPSVATHFSPELILSNKLVFLVAPAEPLRPKEVAIYDEFVRSGGQLFICAGYEESSGCKPLLERFGFQVRNLPLGLAPPGTNAARVEFLGAWPVVPPATDCEVLCRWEDYPLIVAHSYGRGRVVVIGDSLFFANRNLEMPRSYNLDNIEFVRKLVPPHEP